MSEQQQQQWTQEQRDIMAWYHSQGQYFPAELTAEEQERIWREQQRAQQLGLQNAYDSWQGNQKR